MKVFIKILIVFAFIGCKTQKTVVNEVSSEPKKESCVLQKLSKTLDYRSRIKSYKSIYQDTIIEFETIKINSKEYKTIFDLKGSDHYLWMITSKENESDSLLIDCVSTEKWVESNFLLDKCQIIIEYENFDDMGLPKVGGTEIINLNN